MDNPPKSYDRFQYDDDGDQLDEIVLSNVTFHIERMSQHGWWLGVDNRETGEHLSMWFHASAQPNLEHDFHGTQKVIRGPLLYHGPVWRDRRGAEHRCEVETPGHVRCRCECGATRRSEEVQ